MKSRKERREEARANGVAFEPQYNGGRVITKAQYDEEVKQLKESRKKKFSKTTEEATE
jgi:hypothetical protein